MKATLIIITVYINGTSAITFEEQHVSMQACLDQMMPIIMAPLNIHDRVRKIESRVGQCAPH